MANTISRIRKILGEETMEKDIKKLPVKEEEEDDEKKEKEEDMDPMKAKPITSFDKPDVTEGEDEDDEDKEKEEEKLPDEDDEEACEAAKDEEDELAVEAEDEVESDIDKEFDINDDTDVFMDDEEELAAAEAKDADADEDETKDEAKEEDEEDEVEEAKKEDDEEDEVEEAKKEDDEEEVDEVKKPDTDVEEHMKALFNGETLSDGFQKKARTIFESAVREKVLQFAKSLKARYNKKLGSAKQHIQEKIVAKVDGYMDYIVEEWMEQNKLTVERGLRTEITEEFLTDLRNLFEVHNINIPKGKENLVESLADQCEKLKKELDSEIKKNVKMMKRLNEQKKVDVLREICEGLADTEIEKLKSLASTIEYDESYREKLTTIKENYFPSKAKKAAAVDEIVENNKKEDEKVVSSEFSEMQQICNIAKKIGK